MRLNTLLASTGSTLFFGAVSHALQIPIVETTAGPIEGIISLINGQQVKTFVGIPYALTPPERVSPAEPPIPWIKTLRASLIKPACMQQFMCKFELEFAQRDIR